MKYFNKKSTLCILFLFCMLTSCYSKSNHNSKNIAQDNKLSDSKSHSRNISLKFGKYFYSTYREDPQRGTGIGEAYTITITDKGCQLDIEGYQVDTHVECEIKNTQNTNIFEVYDMTNSSKFGEIKQKKNGDLFLNITYFDAFNEKSDNTFYPLKRLKGMKLFTSLTLAGLLPILSSGCHAESNNKTVENHAITTNQIVNTAQPKINLNCQGFELDHDDYLLCDSWQKSNQLNKNISLKNFNKYHKINNIRDLSPSDYAFYATTELTFNEIKYNAYIYPNSRITLENPNKKVKSEMTGELENETTEYICQNQNCKSMFLWGYSDEGLAGESPKVEEQSRLEYEKLLNSLNSNSYKNDLKKGQTKGVMKAKIYMNNTDTSKNKFVYRNVSSNSPLKDSIRSYLSGTTIEEAKQGYKANNLGIKDFNVNVKRHTAYINFRSENLEVESPQDVIDFDFNITKTAKQFSTINDVKICINGISNYQTTLFANEPIKQCDF